MLEWNGVSLVDRSFEEVCTIMDRTGDTVELLVEHAADFRMCDLLDEGVIPIGAHRKTSEDPPPGLAPGKLLKFQIFFISYKHVFD